MPIRTFACETCGKEVQSKAHNRKYCSLRCAAKGRYRNIDPATRFWPKVKVGEPNECWEWQASKKQRGYGIFQPGHGIDGQLAHRYSYLLTHGDLPSDKCVLHKCDNPRCVNPAHLYLGSRAENAADMARKCRGSATKLSATDVTAIRILKEGGVHTILLAEAFGVNRNTIHRIVNGTRRKHI